MLRTWQSTCIIRVLLIAKIGYHGPDRILARALQLDKLASSGANKYNARGIPNTTIVNPHTLEAMIALKGGQSSKSLIGIIDEQKNALNKQYGKSLKRKDLRKFNDAANGVLGEMGKGQFDKALRSASKLAASVAKKAQALQDKAKKVQADVVEAADKRVDELAAVVGRGETKGVARELTGIVSAAKGTDLETKAKELLAKVKAAAAAK